MRRSIKAVCFDLEGPIVDLEFFHHQGHKKAAAAFGLELNLDGCFRKISHFIGGPDEQIAKEIACLIEQENGVKADWCQILEKDKEFFWSALEGFPIDLRPGFAGILGQVREAGLKATVGSSASRHLASVILAKSGLDNLFKKEFIVLREDVDNGKPAPDVWIETAKRAGVEPSEQLIFEDSPRGIVGAAEIGAICVGTPVYNRPDVISELLKAGAKRIFMDWREMNVLALIENLNREFHERNVTSPLL